MLAHIDLQAMNTLMERDEDAARIIHQLLENHQIVVSAIAHEIRNPLTLVSSSLQLIERDHPEVLLFSGWKQTREDVSFMCQLLNELSSFNNGAFLKTQSFSFEKFLKSIAVNFAMSLTDSNIEFSSYIAPNIGYYTGDKNKLQEVLLNLLKNARETFCDTFADSQPQIRLTARQTQDGISVCIQDNGPGIPEEAFPELFRPFYTTKRSGTGLGLPISKRVIDAHEGRISIQNLPSNGCSVDIFLPFSLSGSDGDIKGSLPKNL